MTRRDQGGLARLSPLPRLERRHRGRRALPSRRTFNDNRAAGFVERLRVPYLWDAALHGAVCPPCISHLQPAARSRARTSPLPARAFS
jgi:hypothetical protein